jgi:hypothetical protein
MYGGMEVAAMYVGPPRGTFAGLAERSGFTEAECALAAQTNRLAIIIRLAQLRSQRRSRRRDHGHLSGAVALAQVRARMAEVVA